MKGFVPTPRRVVDDMVEKLFQGRRPRSTDRLLDPGCGTGVFIEGVTRWCDKHQCELPTILGIDSDPVHLAEARAKLCRIPSITLRNDDFLKDQNDKFDYIIGNPPYVPITGLSESEKALYRSHYRTAAGRFDLYLLFFEQALRLLRPGARLVFITPEKFLYVESAGPLRKELAAVQIEELEFVAEATFGNLVTYPIVTTISNEPARAPTRILLRSGQPSEARLNGGGASWLPALSGREADRPQYTLSDACLRISCGVATGADGIYVLKTSEIPAELQRFAYPTVAGREITIDRGMAPSRSMLVPYSGNGDLLPEPQLGALGQYLGEPERKTRLLKRTCTAHKLWYAFHENPPLRDILRPKILCKDIGSKPYFLVDESGEIVPRHSVYYIVPINHTLIHQMCEYLNSEVALSWMLVHCQRAANGFVRLQSHVLRDIPLPAEFIDAPQFELVGAS